MTFEGRVEASSEEVEVFVCVAIIIDRVFFSSPLEDGHSRSDFRGSQGERDAVRVPREAQDCSVERPRDLLHHHRLFFGRSVPRTILLSLHERGKIELAAVSVSSSLARLPRDALFRILLHQIYLPSLLVPR